MRLASALGCLVETDSARRWSPAEIDARIALREVSYAASGALQPGDRCLLTFGNSLEFFVELLALWRRGACVIPVDPRLTAYEVGRLVSAATPTLAVTNDDGTAHREALADVPVVHTLDHHRPASSTRPPSLLRLDGDALVMFTSGSTGQPKGVVHTHRSLRARWATLHQALGLQAYERTLCVLPTHFGHGLICNCLFPWLHGCDLYVAPPFNTGIAVGLGPTIDEHRITFLSSVPSLWNLTLRTSPEPSSGQLRRVHVGSAPLAAASWRQIGEWSGTRDVRNLYGITETASWAVGTDTSMEPEDGLVGVPLGGRVRVAPARSVDDPPEAFAECAPGDSGMIWLETPALMRCYHEMPDLTDEVIRDGWFRSGDIGVCDDRGRLVVRGRERDEINKGGAKVYPADIDAVAIDDPNVLDACAFGFPDQAYGENTALAVVLSDDSGRAVASLRERIERHLAEYKRPVRWYVVDEIPRTSRGKINRTEVGEHCAGIEPIDPDATPTDEGHA